MDPLAGALASLNATLPAIVALTPDEVDPETCQLLGPVALIVQAVMGVLVLGSLLLKRMREKPRRKWRVWSGDVSKQILGQAFVHSSNLAISDLIARHQSDNPCSLYALNIAVDTTVGVLILFGFLKGLTHLLRKYDPRSFVTGDYGTPFSMSIWGKQAAIYVLALALMKIVVVAMFWAIPGLFEAANWTLSWLSTDELQVVFSLLVFPLMMNIFQFLIIDSILKSKPIPTGSSLLASASGDEESRRGFLEPGSSDAEDDDENGESSTPINHSKRGDAGRKTPESLPKYASEEEMEVDDDEWGLGGDDDITPTTTTKLSHSYPPTSNPAFDAFQSSPALGDTSSPILPNPRPRPPIVKLRNSNEQFRLDDEEEEGEEVEATSHSRNSSRSSFEDWDDSDPVPLSEKAGFGAADQVLPGRAVGTVQWASVG